MKTQIKLVLLAVAGAFAASSALAGGGYNPPGGGEDGGTKFTDTKSTSSTVSNTSTASKTTTGKFAQESDKSNVEKVSTDIKINGGGTLNITAKADAATNTRQVSYRNDGELGSNASASVDHSVTGNLGNVGLNVGAGDGNQQSNALAIADLSFVTGGVSVSSDSCRGGDCGNGGTSSKGAAAIASSQAEQDGQLNNWSIGHGDKLTAAVWHSVNGNTGVVGVNVAAGQGNQQGNSTSIANAKGAILASATASTSQQLDHNKSFTDQACDLTAAVGNSLMNNTGNVGVNIASGIGNHQANSLVIAAASGK